MDSSDLISKLDELESAIDGDVRQSFESSEIYQLFSELVNVSVFGDHDLSDEIIEKLDIITDNMDSLNFGLARDEILSLRELLK